MAHRLWKADIVFLADSSQGVTITDFSNEQSFIKRLTRYLNVLPGKSRAAFISYGDTYKRVVGFSDYTDAKDLDRKIDGAPMLGGRRRIDTALEAADLELRQSNPLSQKLVILITSGLHSPDRDSRSLKDIARQLHRQGVLAFVISVGKDPSAYQLRPIVNFPEDIVVVDSFGRLPQNAAHTARSILERSGKTLNLILMNRM